MTESAMKLSNPEVGSSRKSKEGFVITSVATDVRFRSPPLMPLILKNRWRGVGIVNDDKDKEWLKGSAKKGTRTFFPVSPPYHAHQ
jgi:hypothetical protein